jgi:predicted amidohydrolase
VVRVRVVAMRSTTDTAANLAAAVAAVRAGAEAGARLVVLPEYAAAFDPRGVGAALAEPVDGPFVTALREATASGGPAVLAGTVLPGGPDGGGRAVNTVVAVRDGAVVGSYAKVHLYDAFGQRESDRLVPGPADAAPLVVDVDGLAVGVMTCYDLRFPESARRLVDAGAQVLAVPAAWAGSADNRELKSDHWRTLLRARAIENTAWVLGVPMRGRGVVGDLLVVDPSGAVVASGEGDVLDVDLDPAAVDEARATNPSLANRRYRVVPG